MTDGLTIRQSLYADGGLVVVLKSYEKLGYIVSGHRQLVRSIPRLSAPS